MIINLKNSISYYWLMICIDFIAHPDDDRASADQYKCIIKRCRMLGTNTPSYDRNHCHHCCQYREPLCQINVMHQ